MPYTDNDTVTPDNGTAPPGNDSVPHADDDTVSGTPSGTGTWHTSTEACEILGISKRTLWRRIEQGRIQSKLEDGRRLVLIEDSATPSATDAGDTVTGTPGGTPNDTTGTAPDTPNDATDAVTDTPDGTMPQSALVDQLKSEVEFLREQLKEVEDQRNQEKGRSDTIILQLTRNLEQSQRLLEYHEDPWYRRIFRRRSKSGSDSEIV